MNSIQGFGSIQGMFGMSGQSQKMTELTDEQKKKITSILSKYDSENITSESAQAIFKEFADAGITPAKGMKEAIEAAGWDAEKLRELGMPAQQGMQGMQGPGGMRGPGGMQESVTLTDDQKSQVEEILSQYDPDNLTAEDAKAIFKQLQEAGIPPGDGLKEAITSAGFDADSLFELGAPKRGQQQSWATSSTSSSASVNSTALQTLKSILSEFDLTNMTTTTQKDLLTRLNDAGLLLGGDIIDIGA